MDILLFAFRVPQIRLEEREMEFIVCVWDFSWRGARR
jgi:hypothetical protein